MFCKKCGKEMSEDSRFCNYCGAPTTKTRRISKPAIKQVLWIVVGSIILLIITTILLSPKGPPDELVMNNYLDSHQDDETLPATNPQIIGKARCKNLPPDARAMGIKDAWLVLLFDDWMNYPRPVLWVKVEGEWIRAYDNECP